MVEIFKTGPVYFLRWQFPVCALVVVAAAAAAVVLLSRMAAPPLRAAELYLPSWRGVHPTALLLYRAMAAAAMFFMLYHLTLLNGIYNFYFYTVWTFTAVTLYFWLATCISAHGCLTILRKTNPGNGGGDRGGYADRLPEEAREELAGFWGNSLQVLYQICVGAVIMTDIVFWCFLVPFTTSSSFSLNPVNDTIHSINIVFLIIDTFLGSLPFYWFRGAYFLLYSCIYVAFQWILHAYGTTWWPYPFLDLAAPTAPLWYFGIAVVHIPFYGLYILVVRAKRAFASRLFPNAYTGPS